MNARVVDCIKGGIVGGIAGAMGIKALQVWNEKSSLKTLNPRTFTPFTLVSKEPVSPTCAIFTFKAPEAPRGKTSILANLFRTNVWSVELKQPRLQISRSYTPLPPTLSPPDETGLDGELRFLIRRELKGEVSGYLHELSEGATVEIRGPEVGDTPPRHADAVICLAGGTGIAPVLQLAYALTHPGVEEASKLKPKVHILWACRKREECRGGIDEHIGQKTPTSEDTGEYHTRPANPGNPIVKELDALRVQNPDQITVDLFVDEEKTFITPEILEKVFVPPTLRATAISKPPGTVAPRKISIFAAGPEGFVKHYTGPTQWVNGKEVRGKLDGVAASVARTLNQQGVNVEVQNV